MFFRIVADAAVRFALCTVIGGDQGSDGVLAALVVVAEAAGFRHKGVQSLIEQRGSQVGGFTVVVQFVQFTLNGVLVAGNVIVGVGFRNAVIVHVEPVVLHDRFQIGIGECTAVGGHQQADVAAVVQICIQLFRFCIGNILGGCCHQYQSRIVRHTVSFRQVQFLGGVVVVGQVGGELGVAVQRLFAVTGQEIHSRCAVFRHALDRTGDQVFALEVLAGGVAVIISIDGIHGRTGDTFFHVVADKDHVTGGQGECVIGVDLLHGVVVGVRIYPDQVDRLVGIISFQCPIEGEGTHIVFQTVLGGQNVEVYSFSLAVQLIQIFFRGGAQAVLLVGRDVPAEVQTGNDHVQNHSNDQHQNGKRHCHAGEFGVFPVVETVCLFVLTHSSLPPAPASFFNGNDSPDQEYRDFRYISQQVGELHQTLGEYIEFGLVREPAQYIREHRNAGEERVDTQVVHQDQHQHGKFAQQDRQQGHFCQRGDEDAQGDAHQTKQEEADIGTDQAGPDNTAINGGDDRIEQGSRQHDQQNGRRGEKLCHDDLRDVQWAGEQQGFRAVFAFLGECPHGQQRQQEDEIEDVDVKDRGERKRIGR